ncbi:MAG: aminotransferase class I/II-fold pyridoxal phosphate-dependent enzyme [Deltaproteobacteria bacterium]|nr:aminotransferase class I/II-fold pyridoxal phosphate-dependent enzyme [Deltaproteobacteria bacterium]
MFAKRMNQLQSSSIRKMFEMAAKMKNPVNLSLGMPDFDVPANVKKQAVKAINDGKNKYTLTRGIPEFTLAIVDTLKNEGVNTESVMAVSGASGGLVLALLAMADDAAEVLIPDPCFVSYQYMVSLSGAKIRRIDTYPDFRLTPELLAKAVTASKKENPAIKQRILLFNSPVNPTGIAYHASEIKALATTAKKHHLQVISDEVYDRFCYDFKHECWLKHDTNALLIRTLGKTHGMTGWRSGYAAGPASIIEQMTMLQQFTYVCVNTPTQWASIEALKTNVDHLIKSYKSKRDMIYEGLKNHYNLQKPQGAFYAFPECPDGDGEAFLKKCIANEILIVPGSAFSQRHTHFRLSFALSDQELERGIKALVKVSGGRKG